MLRHSSLSALASVLIISAPAFAQVAADYKTPLFVVPYATHKPTIDGAINPDEWRDALSVDALQGTDKKLSRRRARFWITWDEDNLYLAMRSPLRAGERPIQGQRGPGDLPTVMDDSYEFWFDAKTHSPDGQPVFFQFISNFAGARFDSLQEPAVGNMRLGWNSSWQPKNRLTPDNNWEMELAIPRASIYKETPFGDGYELRALLARNFKRPWEQNSVGGIAAFNVSDSYARFRFEKNAPALDFAVDGDPASGALGFGLRASKPVKWSFQSDDAPAKSGALAADETLKLPALDSAAKTGNWRVSVENNAGEKLLDWSAPRAWGAANLTDGGKPLDDKGDRVDLALQLDPVSDVLQIKGDFINYDARADLKKNIVSVEDVEGKTVAQKVVALSDLAYVSDEIALPNLKAGDYKARLESFGADGKMVLERDQPFSKLDNTAYSWWNTKAGNIEKVIAPWTPVQLDGAKTSMWGRQMRTGVAGLPVQINTRDKNLLSAPAYLEATLPNGKKVRAPQRAVLKATSQLAGVTVETLVLVEFDGLYQVEMKIEPGKMTPINNLKLVIPLNSDVAKYIHSCGEGIRYGYYYGDLDQTKIGRIWDSTQVDSQPMAVGSFIPYLWIGNPDGGLCWFADSDQGWTPDNKTPAIEVRRDSKNSTDLVLNLVSSAQTLDKPRNIKFGLQATPVKPLREGWRMDSWWTGDTFQDWAQVQPKGGNLIFSSIPFTLDAAKTKAMVEARHKQSAAFVIGTEDSRANAVPYFEHINMGHFKPEIAYFEPHWKTNVSRGLAYDKSLRDFVIANLSEWAKTTGIDGFYVDNVYPIADDNLAAGRGYVLPDGRVQPTYLMFDTRRYFLRMRAAFAEQGKTGKIVLHMTNNMIIPWIGAADIALDGEDKVLFPENDKDFMDVWPLERLRADWHGQWGVAVNFLQEYQGQWEPKRLAEAMRAYTGMMLLFDVLPSSNSNGLNQPAWIGRARFGVGDADVSFVPYWKAGGLTATAPDVKLAVWKKPGKVLIAVVNRGEKTDATVKIDAAKLGLGDPAKWKISDAEAGTIVNKSYAHGGTQELPGAWNNASEGAVSSDGKGNLTVLVKRHDYRQIIVEAS